MNKRRAALRPGIFGFNVANDNIVEKAEHSGGVQGKHNWVNNNQLEKHKRPATLLVFGVVLYGMEVDSTTPHHPRCPCARLKCGWTVSVFKLLWRQHC